MRAACGTGAFLVLATPASAAHHLVRISEVFPGTLTAPTAEAVELQLLADGENQVAGAASVRLLDHEANQKNFGTFTANPPNGESQRTMLAATPAFQTATGLVPDLELPPSIDALDPTAGSVCFTSTAFAGGGIDCVTWGTGFPPPLVSPVGTQAPAIPDGQSLTRTKARGCPTMLDLPDDTNNSIADFFPSPPTLRNNAGPIVEAACGGGGGSDTDPPSTTITKGPKGKVDTDTVRFRFESDETGSTFECKAPGKPFRKCKSPKKLKNLDNGRQKFKVRAIDRAGNVDPTPARRRFRVAT